MQKKDEFRKLLRKSGYKATPPRLAILDAFTKSKNPMSVQEIIDALPSGMDQATVYRTVKSLAANGILRKIDLRHNHAHYELAGTADHHHLICLSCGRVEDVEHCNVEAIQANILRNSKHFKEVKQHTLEFYGLCKTCAKKTEDAKIIPHKNAPV